MMLLAVLLALAQPAPENPVEPDAEKWVPIEGTYDPGNPFAKIIRGELPVAKVYEDRYVLAFMDRAPISPGHVLVISKTSKARTLFEVSDRDLRRMMAVARRVARAELDGLGATGVRIIQNNGYGQTVPHLHIHVVARYSGVPFNYDESRRQPLPELEATAAKIRAALPPK